MFSHNKANGPKSVASSGVTFAIPDYLVNCDSLGKYVNISGNEQLHHNDFNESKKHCLFRCFGSGTVTGAYGY